MYMLPLTIQGNTNTSGYFQNYFNDLFAKKRILVKLEIDLIDRVRSEWQNILWSTVTDRVKAESSIKDCYRYGGLKIPNIIWLEHPLNVIKISIARPNILDISDMFISELWQSELEIQKSVDADAIERVLTNIDPQDSRDNATRDRHDLPIFDRLNERVMNRVNNLYGDLTGSTIPVPFQNYQTGYLGYFDYFLQIGLNIPRIQPVIDLAKSCGWCWTFENLAILTPKPSQVEVERSGNIIGIIYDDVNILRNLH